MNTKKTIGWIVSIVLTLIAWCIPTEAYGIPGLTVIEKRVIALFVFAAAMWICEAIPIWATSVVIMVLMLVTTSDSMFAPKAGKPEGAGSLITWEKPLSDAFRTARSM